jgi:hypothetical protein
MNSDNLFSLIVPRDVVTDDLRRMSQNMELAAKTSGTKQVGQELRQLFPLLLAGSSMKRSSTLQAHIISSLTSYLYQKQEG